MQTYCARIIIPGAVFCILHVSQNPLPLGNNGVLERDICNVYFTGE
jgi:hypothetical protein